MFYNVRHFVVALLQLTLVYFATSFDSKKNRDLYNFVAKMPSHVPTFIGYCS